MRGHKHETQPVTEGRAPVLEFLAAYHQRLPAAQYDKLLSALIAHYVEIDPAEPVEPGVEAYRDWCQAHQEPFIQVECANRFARLTLSLKEAQALLSPVKQEVIHGCLTQHSLIASSVTVAPDCCQASYLPKEIVGELADWLYAYTSPVEEHRQDISEQPRPMKRRQSRRAARGIYAGQS